MAKLREIYAEPFEIKTEEEVKELKKIYKGRRANRKNFKRGARVHPKNAGRSQSRGGIRL